MTTAPTPFDTNAFAALEVMSLLGTPGDVSDAVQSAAEHLVRADVSLPDVLYHFAEAPLDVSGESRVIECYRRAVLVEWLRRMQPDHPALARQQWPALQSPRPRRHAILCLFPEVTRRLECRLTPEEHSYCSRQPPTALARLLAERMCEPLRMRADLTLGSNEWLEAADLEGPHPQGLLMVQELTAPLWVSPLPVDLRECVRTRLEFIMSLTRLGREPGTYSF